MQQESMEQKEVSWTSPVLKKGEIGIETQNAGGGLNDGLNPS
jgi:hypothetical protein